MSTLRTRTAVTLLVLGTVLGPALAAWPADPAVNLAVADRTGEQVQPKIVSTADGGCYISWFDNYSPGYDVRLQRLDRWGNELWPHNGILVADRSFSSTMDYGLAVDATGYAVLSFDDDRSGSDQITVQRIAPDGTLLWGTGVQLTSTTEFVAAPRVAATSDGAYVVAWTQEYDVVRQRLDAAGTVQWGPTGLREVAPSGAYMCSDVCAGDAGSAIVLWVRPVTTYMSDKHLYTQKYAPDGTAQWNGGNPRIVYDGGSVQNGYFPNVVPDGAGGAVYGWYEISGVRNAYVQHVSAAGLELFPHNGVAASTLTADRIRLSPSHAYSTTTGAIFLFWIESNSYQTLYGLYGQKFSPDGSRRWTDTGRALVSMGAAQVSQVCCAVADPGAIVLWTPNSGATTLRAMGLDGAGTPVWPGGSIAVCSVSSGKWGTELTRTPAGDVLVAWADTRADAANVYAQNVTDKGGLGVPPVCHGDTNCDGDVGFLDIDYFVAAIPNNQVGWEALYAAEHAGELPPCQFANCDVNGNGNVGFDDIDPFVMLIPSACP